MAITGSNFVRFTRHGLQAIRKQWPVCGDRFEIRRMALKLRFWDSRHEFGPGVLCDHSYEAIKSLPNLGIYELRIDDHIGGYDNIRIVFLDPPSDWVPTEFEQKPMRILWVLEALQKKRDDWTAAQVSRFRTARILLKERCYT